MSGKKVKMNVRQKGQDECQAKRLRQMSGKKVNEYQMKDQDKCETKVNVRQKPRLISDKKTSFRPNVTECQAKRSR